MNYLDKLLSNINSRQRKQRINSNKNLIGLVVLGVTLVGTVSVLLTRKFSGEIRNIIISNAKDADEDINENVDLNIDEDVDVDVDEDIEEEIKQTLEKQKGKSIGDVGAAMEEALEELEEEEKAYN